MDSLIASAVTGFLSLVGVIITCMESNKKIDITLEKNQAITDCKLEELTNEVHKHNTYIEKIPVMEEKIRNIESKFERWKNDNKKSNWTCSKYREW